MEIKEIWVSSRKHQIEFNKIHKQNSGIRKAFGLYKMPSDFPFIRLFWQKLPIVYNKRFSLKINDNGLALKPNSKFGLFNRAKNINVGINDPLLINDIISIDRYENPEPFMKMFNINWIQIRFYNGEKEEEEMLFCAGGKLMHSIVAKTNEIFDTIENKLVKG